MREFEMRSEVFLKTGGVHSAAICDLNSIVVFREDIGRHNAIDKVIGVLIESGESFNHKFVLTSGRVSSEVLHKIHKCRIPVIVSHSAPTNQAVKLANDLGVTLVGFARGRRMNIYTHFTRIVDVENLKPENIGDKK